MQRLTLSAWQIDSAGDLGNKERIAVLYERVPDGRRGDSGALWRHLIRDTSRALRWSIALGAAAFLVTLGVRTGEAHKPVTSKYDYNKDVFPLLREHCARCHVQGGPGPMSLMTYTEAVPWAVSIRDELSDRPHAALAGRSATSPPVKGEHAISARDIDMIIEWASGGTPIEKPGDVETQVAGA